MNSTVNKVFDIKVKLNDKNEIILAEQKFGNRYEVTYTKEGKVKISQYGKDGNEVNKLITSKKSLMTYIKVVSGVTTIYDEVGKRIKSNNLGKFKSFIRKTLISIKVKIGDILEKYF
jgi:hypothetical protein